MPDAIKLPEPLPLEGNDPPPPVEPPLPASSPAEPSAKVRLDFSGLTQHALLRPHWRLQVMPRPHVLAVTQQTIVADMACCGALLTCAMALMHFGVSLLLVTASFHVQIMH